MAAFIILIMKISLALSVFALGLTCTFANLTYLFRNPGKLLAALLSMIVVMPAIVVVLDLSFDLHPAVKIALAVLAVSPTPALLPKKALKAGGKENYAIGLNFSGKREDVSGAMDALEQVGKLLVEIRNT